MVNFYDSTSKVSLSIVDYEFENATDNWDLNWLVVSVERIDNDNKVLVKKEPALLTWELGKIRSFILDERKVSSIELMEPELAFSKDEEYFRLTLHWGLKFYPEESDDTYLLENTSVNRQKFLSLIDNFSENFPVRGKPF